MSYGSPTGFVAFNQYLDANQESAEEMARRAGQQATNAAGTDPMLTQQNVNLLNTQPGAQAFLQKATPKGQKTTALDAALAGQGNYFAQLQKQYGHAGDEDLARRVAASKTDPNREANARAGSAMQQPAQPNPSNGVATTYRAQDAKLPPGQMGRERWANLHGMTLEQWIAAGERPAF